MLGKRSRPMIGKLSELFISGGRAAALLDTIGSPKSPLDMMKMQSPRGLKSYDLGGGVGLGIVVALDKSCTEVLPKYAVCTSKNLNRSGPIPVQHSVRNVDGFQENEIDVGSSEDYTYVTYHVPKNKTVTKVYYDGVMRKDGYKNKDINTGVFRRTTPPSPILSSEPEPSIFPTSNFLSSCHLCSKKLDGKDIYMYRGEKAFCSPECRSSQIMMEERKERCRSEASRSGELSSSPYTREQIFSTGILAL